MTFTLLLSRCLKKPTEAESSEGYTDRSRTHPTTINNRKRKQVNVWHIFCCVRAQTSRIAASFSTCSTKLESRRPLRRSLRPNGYEAHQSLDSNRTRCLLFDREPRRRRQTKK